MQPTMCLLAFLQASYSRISCPSLAEAGSLGLGLGKPSLNKQLRRYEIVTMEEHGKCWGGELLAHMAHWWLPKRDPVLS